MSGGVVDGSRNTDDGPPEDFTWSFIFGALGSAAIVTIIIVAYRCRAYRIRREQLAKELEQEQLFELKGVSVRACTVRWRIGTNLGAI